MKNHPSSGVSHRFARRLSLRVHATAASAVVPRRRSFLLSTLLGRISRRYLGRRVARRRRRRVRKRTENTNKKPPGLYCLRITISLQSRDLLPDKSIIFCL